MQVGNIGNYHGGLEIKEENCRYWGIEDWDGTTYSEIPDYLYESLLRYQESLTIP